MPQAVASHVADVAVFGTPDGWFLHLADRDAPSIAIGPQHSAKTIHGPVGVDSPHRRRAG